MNGLNAESGGGVAVQRMVRPHGWHGITAVIKYGMVTMTASQTALKLNSHFEPAGFLTICANASAGTKILDAVTPDASPAI